MVGTAVACLWWYLLGLDEGVGYYMYRLFCGVFLVLCVFVSFVMEVRWKICLIFCCGVFGILQLGHIFLICFMVFLIRWPFSMLQIR